MVIAVIEVLDQTQFKILLSLFLTFAVAIGLRPMTRIGSNVFSERACISSLGSALALAGLLGASPAYANTWEITFDPSKLAAPPAGSGSTLALQIGCYPGSIQPSASVQTDLNGTTFVHLPGGIAAPSTVTVDVSPDPSAGQDPQCSAQSVAWLDWGDLNTSPIPAELVPGYMVGVIAQANGSDFDLTPSVMPNMAMVGHNGQPTMLMPPTVPAGGLQSNLYVMAKSTNATLTVNLSHPMPTATTLSFDVQATVPSYQDPAGNPVDLTSAGAVATYTTSTPLSVTIPIGATSFQVEIPSVLPGSELAIVPPANLPAGFSLDPALSNVSPQRTPVLAIDMSNLSGVFLSANPASPGPFPISSSPNTQAAFVLSYQTPPPVVVPAQPPAPVPSLGAAAVAGLSALVGMLGMRRRRTTK